MSDENFGGPKKPKATFGDVMLGIPSGGRGPDDRGGRREKGPRREGGPQEAKPTGDAAGTAGDDKRGGRRGQGGNGGGGGKKPERKPQGPLVVVKRASGVVETRGPLEDKPAEQPETASAEGATESSEAHAPVPTPRPAAPAAPSALYEEVPEAQSFAEMYEQSAKESGPQRKSVRIGEKVKGKIFTIGADTAFVSLGGKSEAMIELRELKDDEGILRYGVGDEIEAHVLESGAKGIILTRSLTKGSASMAMLAEARASGMPVEGLVLSVNKGGLEVAIGDVRAFCPVSQIDLRFVEKPEQFVGEKFKFRVIEVRDGKNVVVSRRALLEEEQKVLAAETRKKLTEGAVLRGKVTGVRDFGAFVDLGGVEGMIPVSEMSHVRIGHPSEVVKVGDDVEIEILRIEAPNMSSPDKGKHKERITLSMRSRQEDPFQAALAEIQEGSRLKGKVVRLQQFGAFVELRPGVDGLIHISALSNRRIAHPRDVVKVGEEVDVVVEKIDPAEKRIGLRRVVEGEPEPEVAPAAEHKATEKAAPREHAPRPKVGAVVMGKVTRIEPYGVFVEFPGGRGLVPAAETGTERGTDLKRVFQLGQELKTQVLEIDATGKIRLSITAAAHAEERAEMQAWMQKNQPKGGGNKGFGTFADLLKGKKL